MTPNVVTARKSLTMIQPAGCPRLAGALFLALSLGLTFRPPTHGSSPGSPGCSP